MLLFLQTEEEEKWKTKVTVCYRQSWGGQYSARVTEVQMKFFFFGECVAAVRERTMDKKRCSRSAIGEAVTLLRAGSRSASQDSVLHIIVTMSRLRRYQIKPQPSLLSLLLLLLLSLLLSRLTLLFFFFFLRLLLRSLL